MSGDWEGSTVGRGAFAGTLVRSRLLEAKAQSPTHLTPQSRPRGIGLRLW